MSTEKSISHYDPFQFLNSRLDRIEAAIERIIKSEPREDTAISFPAFCRDKGISRPTGYAWADRELIVLEKRGGRQYVISQTDEIKKYQRSPKVKSEA